MTTTIAASRARRVLLRVPDLTVTSAAPPMAAPASTPDLSRQLWSRPKSWHGWVSWTDRFRKLPWQFQVSLLAIVLGGAVIVAARSRTPQRAAPRQPSPINIIGEAAPQRVSTPPTVVSEATAAAAPAVAPQVNENSSPRNVADDRMAHRVFPSRAQAGVAEFEGTISSPILEANHERARPGIH